MTTYTAADLEAAAVLMDDEIREDLSSNYEPGFNDPDAFIRAYLVRHEEKHGERFVWA